MINEELDRMIRQYEENLKMQGLTLEQFYQFTNSDEAALKDQMKEEAEKDTLLLANAQQRAQKLLEDYVNNIGNCVGKTYNIKWIYLDGAKELNEVDLENTSDSETSSIK